MSNSLTNNRSYLANCVCSPTFGTNEFCLAHDSDLYFFKHTFHCRNLTGERKSKACPLSGRAGHEFMSELDAVAVITNAQPTEWLP